MTKQKPIFRKKEVVVKFPETDLNFGGDKYWVEAEVLYVGKYQERYEVGEKILYKYHKSFKETALLEYFNMKLLVLEDAAIKCAIDESI